MTTKIFIEEIAKYVQKYAPKYNIKVHSPIIAQAILESARGTSELAINANNFFGLKYKVGRCPTSCGIYYKVGSEQNADGTYTSSAMQWMKFKNMEDCVIGYFDFINNSRYANLKGVIDPTTYLKNIKSDGYATSIDYVDNLLRVIDSYDLTQYDFFTKDENNKGGVTMAYTNSPLINYVQISPNKTINRTHVIDTITIHCVVGQVTVERLGGIFANASRHASSNYGIGKDGKIGLYVEEKDRSWCSSNTANDDRAITIEVASDTVYPFTVTNKALNSLIELCADICKRNNINKLVWSTNKNERVNHLNGCNMTVHRDYANKSCPGDYLYNKHSYIASEVNKRLTPTIPTTPSANISVNQFTPTKGNSTDFSNIIKNIKLALNTDYGLAFTIDSNIDDILLINLGNVVLSTTSYLPNITYVLQQLFVWWGYTLAMDGVYGSGTQSTVALFQSQVGIAQTGTTTKEFWYKILGR